ncbi:N-acetylglucosamine-6-phosphate deacetylase [Pedobacter aquae]|uniref:N-acetylglucosamine-6-phosphate deacetylase n=1 Tax=Pedobacter aquae TaxID=2605747 RepID=A0A5C0VHZ2_9SPHI|nr:N-acetylglucosamine-6-phosphate deacetylase [Pedobacter aquae]QEK50850.1 N-acetylglucosamine-6-phosphate deacetylase [Pedobacter aquae]
MANQLKIIHAKVILPSQILEDATLLVCDGVITAISDKDIDAPLADVLDAEGNYLSPGFIDLHVHGGGGYDFMDRSVDAFLKIAETHLRYGTTAMFPTTLTSTTEKLIETLSCYEEAHKLNHKGAQFMGMHLEGPYFAMSQRGAQDPRYIRNPDPKEYQKILETAGHLIKRWSAAPELEGAIAFAKQLKKYHILPAIAHTDAIYEEVIEAFHHGYTLATHFYSAMSGVTRRNAYRYAGVIESGYLIDDMDVEIIADGAHLPAPLLKLIYKIKGPSRTALITDAMRAAGMPEGETILGDVEDGIKVIVEDGVAKLPDRSAFAGSVATADRLVRTMINIAEIPLLDAITMITATPARIMGIQKQKGSIEIGKDADLVVFDDEINIKATIVKGTILYQKPE